MTATSIDDAAGSSRLFLMPLFTRPSNPLLDDFDQLDFEDQSRTGLDGGRGSPVS